MELFRVVIAGSREFKDFKCLCTAMDKMLLKKRMTHKIQIVSGKARGADRLGEMYATVQGFEIVEYPADWDLHGKAAGYRRNEIMAKNSDATVAFWDGKSRGTKHMIDLTKQYGNLIKVFRYR